METVQVIYQPLDDDNFRSLTFLCDDVIKVQYHCCDDCACNMMKNLQALINDDYKYKVNQYDDGYIESKGNDIFLYIYTEFKTDSVIIKLNKAIVVKELEKIIQANS